MADFPETFTGVTFQFGIICCQASLWIMYKQPVLQTHFTFSPAFFSIKLVQQSLYMYDPVVESVTCMLPNCWKHKGNLNSQKLMVL